MIQAAVQTERAIVRCAVYTRKSHEEGLDQDFNSLDAQREACEAYVASQKHDGWVLLPDRYDDGGFSGGDMDRPALQRLLADVADGRVDCIVVYKVDRLSRSLLDFARLMALFDEHGVSFASVSQPFSTATSMGRLTLNVLLSFAQFERETIAERIRDKVAAAKRRGKYTGGPPILGYDVDRDAKRLVVNSEEADLVRRIFRRFLVLRSTLKVAQELNRRGHRTKSWTTKKGTVRQGRPWNKMSVYRVLTNRKYIGEVTHRGNVYPGEHEAIVDRRTWDRVEALLATNGHARARETRRKTAALLKGIIRCGHCGRAMGTTFTTRRGKRYRYYLCNRAEKHGRDTCPIKSVAASDVERAVVEQLRHVFRTPEMVARTFRAVQAKVDEDRDVDRRKRQNLETRAAELKRAIRRLASAEGGGFLAEQLETLNGELAAVEGQLRSADGAPGKPNSDLPTEQEVADALRHVDPLWDQLFPSEQERIVRLLVKEVVVNTEGLVVRLKTNGLKSLVAELEGTPA
ncbi:MAG: recombinase family protein [Phycisphaerae bacterium]